MIIFLHFRMYVYVDHTQLNYCTMIRAYVQNMQIPITPNHRVLVRMDVHWQYLRLAVNTLQKSRCTQA